MSRIWIGIVSFMALATLQLSALSAQENPEFEPFGQADFRVLTGDVQRPNGIYWFEGFLYTNCAGDWTTYRLYDQTGETITYMFGVKNAHMLYVEAGKDDPILWAVDFQDNQLVKVTDEEGPRAMYPVRTGLAAPWGLTPSATGDSFYITEWGSDNLINISRDGQAIEVVASNLEDPSGLVATEDAIYFANNGSARRALEWVEITENGYGEPQALVTGLQKVSNVVLGPDGFLYIAYALGTRGVVGRVDPVYCREKGGCSNTDVQLIVWTELAAPLAGLVVTPDMRLFVHTMFGSEIYWLDLTAKGLMPASTDS